jgi:SAM-dependent methyltransferase
MPCHFGLLYDFAMTTRKYRSSPSSPYDEEFYAGKNEGSYRSAMIVLPLVFSVVAPRSVVDLGCGSGTWLRAAHELGAHDYLGYDGPHVTRLCIPQDRFAAVDLRQPVPADRKFDLAISCEVAEHLPATSAATLVGALTSLSDVVLFSAAIPGQGGVHHVNEQWPAYWQALFRDRKYSAYDLIRPRIWNDDRVEVWYRQNTVLYVADSAAPRYHLPEKTPEVRGMVHPELYESQRRKKLLRNAVRSTRRALARWTGRDNTR